MSDIVLDYSESLIDEVNDWGLGDQPSRPLLLSPQGTCPYCKCPLAVVHEDGIKDSVPTMEEGYSSPKTQTWYAKAWLCKCGWWETESVQKHTMDVWNSVIFEVAQASLRRFSIESAEAPIAALQDHVRREPRSLNYLHPNQMERLTQSVFRDFYNCEVEHCGRSHDGGVELILVDSDSPIAVQVKRRRATNKSEAVSVVREFLGACLLQGYRKGVLVTTAEDFSMPAIQAAKHAVTKEIVESFELVNGRELFRRLNLVTDRDPGHWKKYVDKDQRIEIGI